MIQSLFEKVVVLLSWMMASILCLSVTIFLGFLLVHGLPSLGIELIFGKVDPYMALTGAARVFDGLFPSIVGTLYLVILSTMLALPVGLCSGIYLSEYANSKIKNILGIFFDILAGIPSIVIGLFGFSLSIFLHNHFSNRFGPCLLVSAISLAVLVLPYIVRSTQLSLEELSPDIRKTGIALGANKLQNLFYILIPNSLSGIGSGVILSIGRCAEDTAVILMTGVVATAGIPSALLSQYEALPFYIYYISNQYVNQKELSNGYGASLILLCVCGVLFIVAYGINKHLSYRTLHRL